MLSSKDEREIRAQCAGALPEWCAARYDIAVTDLLKEIDRLRKDLQAYRIAELRGLIKSIHPAGNAKGQH
jgi:hypothetical protein